MAKNFKNWKQNCKFYEKNMLKSVIIKKTITLSKKSSSNLLLNAKEGSLSSEAKKPKY